MCLPFEDINGFLGQGLSFEEWWGERREQSVFSLMDNRQDDVETEAIWFGYFHIVV